VFSIEVTSVLSRGSITWLRTKKILIRWEKLTCMYILNQTVNDGVAHSKNPRKCAYHVTFDLDLDLEHTLDARWPGVYLVKVWWRSGHLSARRSDLRKSLRTDRRRTPRHCISSFLEWAKNNLVYDTELNKSDAKVLTKLVSIKDRRKKQDKANSKSSQILNSQRIGRLSFRVLLAYSVYAS